MERIDIVGRALRGSGESWRSWAAQMQASAVSQQGRRLDAAAIDGLAV